MTGSKYAILVMHNMGTIIHIECMPGKPKILSEGFAWCRSEDHVVQVPGCTV